MTWVLTDFKRQQLPIFKHVSELYMGRVLLQTKEL